MYTHNLSIHITKSLFSGLFLLFVIAGCGSTGPETETGPSFTSGLLGPGDTFSYTFEEVGTVPYYCTTHTPNMTGRVRVVSSAEISGQDTVEMRNIQFVPGEITVAPNTTVVWVNREGSSVDAHTIKSGNPSQGGNGGSGY